MRNLLFLLLIFLSALPVKCAQQPSILKYDSETLLEQSTRYIRHARNDSALLCLTAVMRRYYDDPTDKSKAPDAVRALHKLANLYWNTSHEYGVTYYTLQAAISIAEAEGLNDLLPYLYLDLAAMWDQQSLAFDQGNAQAQQYMHAAYNTAIKSGHTEALPAVAVNMCIAEHFHPDIRYDAELKSIENTRLPATAQCRDVSLLFIAGHKAM